MIIDLVRNDNYVSKLSQIFSIAISPDLERTSRLLQPLAGRLEDFTIDVSNLSNFTSMCMCIFLLDPSPVIGYPGYYLNSLTPVVDLTDMTLAFEAH